MIDDDAAATASVRAACRQLGLAVAAQATIGAGLQALSEGRWVALVLSLDLPAADLALVRRIREQSHSGAVILVAGAPTLRLAVEATAAGALELLARPLEEARLVEVLRAAAVQQTGVPLPPVEEADETELVGTSPSLLDVFKTVGRVAATPATVLVSGESGTGKELVARAIHRASPRAAQAFVAVNCAAIPEDLLESELFGHERGAFTGAVARKVGRWERAHRGTLFLDEIGDMSLVLQAKILRALQEGEIERLGGEERIRLDVRVVAATHRDLGALIREGEFREDLYYRLAVVPLHLPPLRERAGDIRSLALHFTTLFARRYGRPIRSFAAAALDRLAEHSWPGNVRELRNALERAVLQCTGEVLLPEHLMLDSRRAAETADHPAEGGYLPRLSMAEVEALHIRRVLDHVGGNYVRAAEILGMHRNTVSRKAHDYGIAAADQG